MPSRGSLAGQAHRLSSRFNTRRKLKRIFEADLNILCFSNIPIANERGIRKAGKSLSIPIHYPLSANGGQGVILYGRFANRKF